jgi:hypothetical protein
VENIFTLVPKSGVFTQPGHKAVVTKLEMLGGFRTIAVILVVQVIGRVQHIATVDFELLNIRIAP